VSQRLVTFTAWRHVRAVASFTSTGTVAGCTNDDTGGCVGLGGERMVNGTGFV
jgi:hypothetical protein